MPNAEMVEAMERDPFGLGLGGGIGSQSSALRMAEDDYVERHASRRVRVEHSHRAAYAAVFGTEAAGMPPGPEAVRCRAVRCAASLGAAVAAAWGDEAAQLPPIDCLFALERLGAPYRNIRGADIAQHTEPIDTLWPLASPPLGSAAAARLEAWLEGGEDGAGWGVEAGAGAGHGGIGAAATAALRELAGVQPDALSLAIGDGGNEVGMGRAVLADEIAELSPGGEFAPLRVNGCYRGCEHLLAATVSNWGGSAFEAAAHALCPHDALAYRQQQPQQPQPPQPPQPPQQAPVEELEEAVLSAIMAPPYGAVDGKHSEMAHAVDGLAWEPYHRELYEHLWQLAAAEQ